MKAVDFKSLIVAGVIGAVLMYLFMGTDSQNQSATKTLGLGFAIGTGVQIGVRLTGVS